MIKKIMHQHLKQHPEKSFLRFQKVYVYITNTKKPWDKLTIKEREHKNFKWACRKWFMFPNGELTEEAVKDHEKNCPEAFEYIPGVNDNCEDITKNWKYKSEWYDIYPSFPLTEYDMKLLINVIGLRMCHFVNVNRFN